MVGAWNVLPGMVVKAYTTVEFRRLLDRHMDMQGMDHVQADELILASCLAQTLWAEGPVAVLSYGSIPAHGFFGICLEAASFT